MEDKKSDSIINQGDSLIEHDVKKLQRLAIMVDRILKEEIKTAKLECGFSEARVYNIRTVGVQGDGRTYKHPAEITLTDLRHSDGRKYSDDERNDFLKRLSTRLTNEIVNINRVVYLTGSSEGPVI